VLRITAVPDKTPAQLSVEGRLVGPWVAVLESELGKVEARGSSAVVLELSQVQFADRAAVEMLRRAEERGVTLEGCSPLLASLLEGVRP
jgi:anti-anti-sigma regulatory factor